jgi:SAM-dependent methyltransferase
VPEHDFFAESAAYERFMGRWSRRLASSFVEWTGGRASDTILDVGSGTGALASTVAHRAPSARVIGIDPSSAYVHHARQANGRSSVRFLVGAAGALPFPGGSFDRTLSLLVLNFVRDPAAAVREMVRVTRPGGTVAAAIWDYGRGMEMLRAFWDEAVALDPGAASRDERHMPLSTEGALGGLWRASGLQNVEERPLVVEQTFASFGDYWTPFLGGQGPAGAYVRMLPDADRTRLEERLRARLVAGGEDGPLTLRARAWAARGAVP